MIRDKVCKLGLNEKKRLVFWTMALCLLSNALIAQVTSSIDSTSIKIGEQITYIINVDADTTNIVVFPEGQTFAPLEMINSYDIDTLKKKDKYKLIKKYGLTQFDSGAYTIPKQKIVIGDKVFLTDSLQVEVNNILVDTTKQGLYDIKPLIEVKKKGGNWWKYILGVLLAIGIIGLVLWWFIWRKKPLTEEEQIALLPPYDRAKLALKKLDESHYLEHEELKNYYSELTLIIRKYLDEKVYDHSLESTTDELVSQLRLLKDGNQIDLSKDTIKNIESILKRADLVKFAKSAPDVALAELDRKTIGAEIDHVKEVLPEASEEEKLLDEEYRNEVERKKKRKKIILTVAISVFLIMATVVGFSIKYGFEYVKDSVIGHESKELLEGEWVTSEYGFPPFTITTPKVLKRMEVNLPKEVLANEEVTMFHYGSLIEGFNIVLTTSRLKNQKEDAKINIQQAVENNLKLLESGGATDIITQNEKFTTPNGAEGIKVYGTLNLPTITPEKRERSKYAILGFTSKNIVQQFLITWRDGDEYAEKIVDRILNSVELKKDES